MKWQLAAIAILVLASVIGIVRLCYGAISVLGVGVNLFWVLFDVIISAWCSRRCATAAMNQKGRDE